MRSIHGLWSVPLAWVVASGCGGSAPPARSPEGGASGPTLVVGADLAEEAAELSEERPLRVVTPAEAERVPAEAQEHVEAARRAYVGMDFDDALARIREAVILLESKASERRHFDALAEALVMRGMAELALGREDAARESLRAAARLRPRQELDEGRYPPPVRELHATVREEIAAEPAASLTVATRPGGARLFLDGEARGTSPQTLYGTSGRHQLRVEAPGFATRALTVTLDAGGEQLEVELPPADPEAAARQLLEANAERADRTARERWRSALAADAVLVVHASDGGIVGHLVDLESGEVTERRGTSLGGVIEALEAGSAAAAAAGRDRTYRNSGFFARATLGTALRTDQLRREDAKASGGSLAIDSELAVGGSLAPGVVLGGSVMVLFGGPTLDAGETSQPRVGSVGALAGFLTWYPGAAGGFFLGLHIGAARAEVRGGGTEVPDEDMAGGVLALEGGYEWGLAPDWGLGVLLRLIGYQFEGGGTSWSAGGLSVAGTITYN